MLAFKVGMKNKIIRDTQEKRSNLSYGGDNASHYMKIMLVTI